MRTARVATAGGPAIAVRATAAARAVAVALPLPAFKRAPEPAYRPRPRPAPAIERSAPAGGIARRAGLFVVSLPDHPWLDRVVRGRVWIPLFGVLLAGIVATQVEILKLGANMGRSLEQTSTLTTQNEQLQGSVAMLADDQRIERLAGAMGLVFPPPGAVGYLSASSAGNLSGALANVHTPDSAAFVMLPAKNGGMITGPGTSTVPPVPGAPPPPAATTTTTTTSATPSSGPTTSSSAGTSTSTTAATSTQQAQTTQQTQTTSQAATTTSQTQPAAGPQSTAPSSASNASGAAAISPSGSSQQSSGG